MVKLNIKVTPNSSISGVKNAFIDSKNDICVEIKTNKPPVDGKANDSVINILTEFFNVKKHNVLIIKGEFLKHKIIEIQTITKEDCLNIINNKFGLQKCLIDS